MKTQRQLIRAGLKRLGYDAVLLAAVNTMGVNRNGPMRGTFCGCFVTFAVAGETIGFGDPILAGLLEGASRVIGKDPDMVALSASHYDRDGVLEEEVERFLGVSIAEAQRIVSRTSEPVTVSWRDGTQMEYRVREGVLEARRHGGLGSDWFQAQHTVESISEIAEMVSRAMTEELSPTARIVGIVQ